MYNRTTRRAISRPHESRRETIASKQFKRRHQSRLQKLFDGQSKGFAETGNFFQSFEAGVIKDPIDRTK